MCYITFVTPVLVLDWVWMLHLGSPSGKSNTWHRETYSVVIRFVTRTHDRTHGSTARNMAILEWPILTKHRAKIKLKILHKAKLGIIDIPLSDLTSSPFTTRRSSTDYRVPQSSLDSHKFIFSQYHLNVELPPNIKNVTGNDSFSTIGC